MGSQPHAVAVPLQGVSKRHERLHVALLSVRKANDTHF